MSPITGGWNNTINNQDAKTRLSIIRKLNHAINELNSNIMLPIIWVSKQCHK
jgi:hypothetical protein